LASSLFNLSSAQEDPTTTVPPCVDGCSTHTSFSGNTSSLGSSVQGQCFHLTGNVTVNNTIVFDNCNFIIDPCVAINVTAGCTLKFTKCILKGEPNSTTMWEGINVSDNTSGIHIEHSCIYDAQTAVNILDEPHVWIAQNIFYDNLRSIKIRLTSSAANPIMDVKIMANQFSTSNSIRDLCSTDPHFATLSTPNHSYRHIDLEQVYRTNYPSYWGVVIGDTTYCLLGPNVFTYGDYGVFGTRSSTSIINSEFHYIGNSSVDYNTGLFQSAVFLRGGNVPVGGNAYGNALRNYIGGFSNCSPVIFDHCLHGAHLRGKFAYICHVFNQFVNNDDWDIYLWDTDNAVVYIGNNEIDNSGTGKGTQMVYFKECTDVIDFVMENNIVESSSVSNIPGSGIYVFNCNPDVIASSSPYMIFRTNQISNNQKGIRLDDSQGAWITENIIEMPDYNLYKPESFGIHANIGSGHLIEHNKIIGLGSMPGLYSGTWPSTPPTSPPAVEQQQKGILNDASNDNDIKCNYLENVSWNLVVSGTNNNTKFTVNEMNAGNRGYVVYNNGSAFDQVSATTPCENTWTGSWATDRKVFAYYNPPTYTANNRLYLRTPIQVASTDNGSTDYFNFVPITPVTLSTSPTNLCGDDGGSGNNAMAYGGDNSFIEESNGYYQTLLEKSELSATESVILHDLMVYHAKNALFSGEEVPSEMSLVESEAKVELALNASDFEAAYFWNDNMNTDFQASSIQQSVNRFRIPMLQEVTWTPTDEDFNTLSAIANLCPNEYGRGVKQARIILENYLDANIEFENTCEVISDNTERKMYNNPSIGLPLQIKISPNPISVQEQGNLSIDASSAGIANLISIQNGKLIRSWHFEKGVNQVLLDNTVSPGVYLLSYKDLKGTIVNKKVLIHP